MFLNSTINSSDKIWYLAIAFQTIYFLCLRKKYSDNTWDLHIISQSIDRDDINSFNKNSGTSCCTIAIFQFIDALYLTRNDSENLYFFNNISNPNKYMQVHIVIRIFCFFIYCCWRHYLLFQNRDLCNWHCLQSTNVIRLAAPFSDRMLLLCLRTL